jgi:hypothetical protein
LNLRGSWFEKVDPEPPIASHYKALWRRIEMSDGEMCRACRGVAAGRLGPRDLEVVGKALAFKPTGRGTSQISPEIATLAATLQSIRGSPCTPTIEPRSPLPLPALASSPLSYLVLAGSPSVGHLHKRPGISNRLVGSVHDQRWDEQVVPQGANSSLQSLCGIKAFAEQVSDLNRGNSLLNPDREGKGQTLVGLGIACLHRL